MPDMHIHAHYYFEHYIQCALEQYSVISFHFTKYMDSDARARIRTQRVRASADGVWDRLSPASLFCRRHVEQSNLVN